MLRAAFVAISDHALVRWLERAKGVDMEFFRNELRALVEDAARSGAKSLHTPECTFVFDKGVLSTVLSPKMKMRKQAQRKINARCGKRQHFERLAARQERMEASVDL